MQQLSNKQIKQHQTNIKSAVGAYGMALIMTLVYTGKALLGQNFNFYFSNFVPEVLLKCTTFTKGYAGAFSAAFSEVWRGSLPMVWFCVLFAAYAAVCVAFLLVASKHPPFIWAVFAFHLLDTAALLLGRWRGIPNGMEETMWIDVIFHGLVLLFLLVGGISAAKLPKELRGDPRADAPDQIIKMDES